MSEFIFTALAFTVFFAVILTVYNNNAVVKKYKITSDKVSEKLRIAVISDFHNKKYNHNNSYLTDKIKAQHPDIIIISGDFVDRRRPDLPTAKAFLSALRSIAQTYYITGNHEAILGIDETVTALDCRDILLDERFVIMKDYSVLGLSDVIIEIEETRKDKLFVFEKLENFKIAVVHRPIEFADSLCLKDRDIDLVISGHAHGGLIRIPFFGAIWSPNEGFFPKYSKGMVRENGTTMVVSGGIGNSSLPLRINNFPEIVIIDIEN